jgi:Hint domain
MPRFFRIPVVLLLSLVFILAACTPAAPATVPTGTATPVASTPVVSTAVPSVGTLPPADYTPPPSPTSPPLTPIPTLDGGLGPTELKYRVLADFPDFFYCDPDLFPIAQGNEEERALQSFPDIQANSEEFDAILAHNDLSDLSALSDVEKLLVYREHKKLAALPFELSGNSYHFQLQSAKSEGTGELITGNVDGQGTISIEKKEPTVVTCPICLAAGTLIDTPAGQIPVESLRGGMSVWTLDRDGERVARPLIRLGRTVVPASHQVVHIVLADGRELWVSPGHPTADGRLAGRLLPGEKLDGGLILSIESVKYSGYATYDLLPDGDTGFYWANGILLDSTLRAAN